MMTRSAALLDGKLRAALKELESKTNLCNQLLQERDDSEVEVKRIVDKNTDLKNQLAELHIQHMDILDQHSHLRQLVSNFQECNDTHELALRRISELEIELSKAHNTITQLEAAQSSEQSANTCSLFNEYYYPLYLLLAIFIPMYVPLYFFGEHWWHSLLVCYFLRYVFSLHGTWFVNSIAHLYGTRPYDKNLQPVESWFVSVVTLGEGWHNYHHAFPWDYKAAELSYFINHSATFIEFLDMIGLAYDLKTASPAMVLNRIARTGDGSHYLLGDEETRKAVTAWGPLHPLNPTYNSTLQPPSAVLKPEGLPLFHEKDVLKLKISRRSASTA